VKPWAAFFPDMLVHVYGAPDPLIELELRRAATEFFKRTRAWMEWIGPVACTEGIREYDIDKPSGTDVITLEKVTLNNIPVRILSYRNSSIGNTTFVGGVPGAASPERLTVLLDRDVSTDARLEIQVSLMPSRVATGLPDLMFEYHADSIVAGALARLQRIPKQEFTDLQQSAINAARFEADIGASAYRAWRGETNVTPRQKVNWC